MQNNNAPFKPIMQSQWNFVSIELIQIAGSGTPSYSHTIASRGEVVSS